MARAEANAGWTYAAGLWRVENAKSLGVWWERKCACFQPSSERGEAASPWPSFICAQLTEIIHLMGCRGFKTMHNSISISTFWIDHWWRWSHVSSANNQTSGLQSRARPYWEPGLELMRTTWLWEPSLGVQKERTVSQKTLFSTKCDFQIKWNNHGCEQDNQAAFENCNTFSRILLFSWGQHQLVTLEKLSFRPFAEAHPVLL